MAPHAPVKPVLSVAVVDVGTTAALAFRGAPFRKSDQHLSVTRTDFY